MRKGKYFALNKIVADDKHLAWIKFSTVLTYINLWWKDHKKEMAWEEEDGIISEDFFFFFLR